MTAELEQEIESLRRMSRQRSRPTSSPAALHGACRRRRWEG
jgi:hypothetical protein